MQPINAERELHLEPIGLVFVFFFGLILIIQFVAMLFHRFGTLSHILASTELGCCNRKVKNHSSFSYCHGRRQFSFDVFRLTISRRMPSSTRTPSRSCETYKDCGVSMMVMMIMNLARTATASDGAGPFTISRSRSKRSALLEHSMWPLRSASSPFRPKEISKVAVPNFKFAHFDNYSTIQN